MTVSLNDVVTRLSTEANNSTLGWDVVVNYSETELNSLLAHSYHNDKNGPLKVLNVEITGIDEDFNPYTINFRLELGPPLITFVAVGVQPSCTLTIPVNGGEAKTAKASFPVAAGSYEIKMSNLELATVSGASGSRTPSNQPFVFPPQDSKPAAVTIDFGTSGELVAKLLLKSGAPVNKPVEAHKGKLENKIFEFFTDPTRVSSIQYQLAKVGSSAPPPGAVALRPRSFRFAVYHSEQHPRSILSIFIQATDGAHRGTEVDLQAHWLAKWIGDSSYNLPPIPDTHTASIIFNSTMMFNAVISPALRRAGMSADSPSFDSGKGFQYKIRTNLKVGRDAWEKWTPSDPVHHSVSAFSVDLNQEAYNLRLTLGQHGKPEEQAKGSVTWYYKYSFEYGVDYDRKKNLNDDDPQRVYKFGTAEVEHNLKKDPAVSNILSDTELKLGLTIAASDWDKPKATQIDKSLAWRLWGADIPPNEVLPAVPSLNITLGDLCFFLTTNLLLPGQKVIDVDSTAGLRIPHDYYIVGKVVSKDKVSQKKSTSVLSAFRLARSI